MNSGKIFYWDVNQELIVQTLCGHTNVVNSLKVLRDGVTLASASADTTIKLWNITTGILIYTFTNHTASVNSIDQLNNGYLISASDDGKIIIWDLANFEYIQIINGYANTIYGVKTLSNEHFASSGNDNYIRIWDTTSFDNSFNINVTSATIYDMQLLSNGLLAIATGNKQVSTWNITTGIISSTFSANNVVNAIKEITNDPIILAGAGSTNGQLLFFNISSGNFRKVNQTKGVKIFNALILYNSTFAYAGGYGYAQLNLFNPSNFAIGPAFNLTALPSADYVACFEKTSIYLY